MPTDRRKPRHREITHPSSKKLGLRTPQGLGAGHGGSAIHAFSILWAVCCVLDTEDVTPRPLPPWSYGLAGTHTVNKLTRAGYRQREPGAMTGELPGPWDLWA